MPPLGTIIYKVSFVKRLRPMPIEISAENPLLVKNLPPMPMPKAKSVALSSSVEFNITKASAKKPAAGFLPK